LYNNMIETWGDSVIIQHCKNRIGEEPVLVLCTAIWCTKYKRYIGLVTRDSLKLYEQTRKYDLANTIYTSFNTPLSTHGISVGCTGTP
jgi:hypothetical protein